jgi:hypothetical protein
MQRKSIFIAQWIKSNDAMLISVADPIDSYGENVRFMQFHQVTLFFCNTTITLFEEYLYSK